MASGTTKSHYEWCWQGTNRETKW